MHPLEISADGRSFVDQYGAPVFWMGTTQWELVRRYTLEEARLILQKTRDRGFTFAMVMLLGVGDGNQPNVEGHTPWRTTTPAGRGSTPPLVPNEPYFRPVDRILEIARSMGLFVLLTVYHQSYRAILPADAVRGWARWIAGRCRDDPTLIWSMTPETKPEYAPIMREMAAGLRDGDDGRHLITLHPDPAPHEPGYLHDEPWLAFSCIQTWKWVEAMRPMILADYGLRPVKPVVMAEGVYEDGSEYGFDVTPLWVRRQAYYSYLSGAHHAYGHNSSWRVLPDWAEALDAPGARQLGLLKGILLKRPEWWRMIPYQGILTAGGATDGSILTIAARHPDRRWALVYCATAGTFTVRADALSGPSATATWIDPRTAEALAPEPVLAKGDPSFKTPDGWEDALLLLEGTRT